jgi:AI-2 transport protein TqsA
MTQLESHRNLQMFCMLLITAVAGTMALNFTQKALVPFVFALFYYAASLPVIHFLEQRLRLPNYLALLSTFAIVASLTGLIILMLTHSISGFIAGVDQYRDNFLKIADMTVALASRFGVELDLHALRSALNNVGLFSMVREIATGALGILGNAIIVMIMYLFLILGKAEQSYEKSNLQMEVENKISRYIITKAGTSVATGLIIGIAFIGFQVDLAVMFAILTILLNFIPTIGSIIATLLPIPVILLQFGLGWQFIVLMSVMGLTQLIIGNIIEPKLMGEGMDLHPVSILVFLIFWGLVWGLAGMFLAVPITAVLKIILGRFPATHMYAELLAGRVNFKRSN